MAEQFAVITAAILAGGLGTRLRPVIGDSPKVLAPVTGRRFLAYLLDQLVQAGIQDVIVCTGHGGELVREAFGGRYRSLHLRYSQEAEPLGTAGALGHAAPLMDSETVLVLNGDSYCDFDLRGFLDWHHKKHAEVSMVLTEVAESGGFGSVECDPSDRLMRFREKSQTGPGWINAGVYLISKELLNEVEAGVATSIERECFPSWRERQLFAYRTHGRFIDIGTPTSFAEAQRFFSPFTDTRCTPRRYVILDRDGTVTFERHYLSDPGQIELLPGAAAGLKDLSRAGFGLVIMTNQSAIGRGFFDIEQLGRIHDRLRGLLGDADIGLDGIYYCPHTPQDGCECRKPKTAMLQRAAQELGFVPQESFVIGDKACDIETGTAVGATTLLVRTGYGDKEASNGVAADFGVADLAEAAALILRLTDG